jgi:hypothetical protein
VIVIYVTVVWLFLAFLSVVLLNVAKWWYGAAAEPTAVETVSLPTGVFDPGRAGVTSTSAAAPTAPS